MDVLEVELDAVGDQRVHVRRLHLGRRSRAVVAGVAPSEVVDDHVEDVRRAAVAVAAGTSIRSITSFTSWFMNIRDDVRTHRPA